MIKPHKTPVIIMAIATFLLSLVVAYVISVKQEVERFELAVGKSKDEVIHSFGKPDWIVQDPEDATASSWVYYIGPFGGGASLEYDGDRVTRVHIRTTK